MPQEQYVLIGTTEGRVAFIKDTPQRLADTLRYGEFDNGVICKSVLLGTLSKL